MAGSRQFGYPLTVLAKRLASFGFLVLLWLFLVSRFLSHGQMKTASEFTILFLLLTAFPAMVMLISYSTIICDPQTISARCLGITWRKMNWADVSFVQRVRGFADPATKTRLLSDRFFIGRDEKKTWRASFSAEISGLEELLRILKTEATKNNFGLYAVDTVPKQLGPSEGRSKSIRFRQPV